MKLLKFIIAGSLIFISSCNDPCGSKNYHCELVIHNTSNTKVWCSISSRSYQDDTLNTKTLFGANIMLIPNVQETLYQGDLKIQTSIETALSNCWKEYLCVYFYKIEANSTDPFSSDKLLLRKDYNIDSLNANNWTITYP